MSGLLESKPEYSQRLFWSWISQLEMAWGSAYICWIKQPENITLDKSNSLKSHKAKRSGQIDGNKKSLVVQCIVEGGGSQWGVGRELFNCHWHCLGLMSNCLWNNEGGQLKYILNCFD